MLELEGNEVLVGSCLFIDVEGPCAHVLGGAHSMS